MTTISQIVVCCSAYGPEHEEEQLQEPAERHGGEHNQAAHCRLQGVRRLPLQVRRRARTAPSAAELVTATAKRREGWLPRQRGVED